MGLPSPTEEVDLLDAYEDLHTAGEGSELPAVEDGEVSRELDDRGTLVRGPGGGEGQGLLDGLGSLRVDPGWPAAVPHRVEPGAERSSGFQRLLDEDLKDAVNANKRKTKEDDLQQGQERSSGTQRDGPGDHREGVPKEAKTDLNELWSVRCWTRSQSRTVNCLRK